MVCALSGQIENPLAYDRWPAFPFETGQTKTNSLALFSIVASLISEVQHGEHIGPKQRAKLISRNWT